MVFIVPKIVVVLLNRIEYNRELSDGVVNGLQSGGMVKVFI